jgi:hypothetical protein
MLDSNMSEMTDPTSPPLYQSLNAERHEIRLLRILEQAETITCTLEITSIDASPTYSALSYEWGRYQGEDPGEHVPPIVLNSLPISTTTNLSLALKYLNKVKGPYWIDALCINQEDDNERGHQVRMMTRIYQGAAKVYAWLGLSDEGSTLGVQLLEDFYNEWLGLHQGDLGKWAFDWVRERLGDPKMYPRWNGLCKIQDNSYWNRLWIVQELVVPPGSLVILKHGSQETMLASLYIIQNEVSRLRDIEFGGVFGNPAPRIKRIFSKVASSKAYQIMENAARWHEKNIEEMGLLNLLARYFNSACSNPRDRAYALLGIGLGKEGHDLEINYSAPLHKVFLDVAQYIIHRAQRLDILGVYKGARHVRPLPSWAPDWELSSELKSSPNYFPHVWMDEDYDASAKSTISISFSHGATVLTVRCILLGSITMCSLPVSVDSGDAQNRIAIDGPRILEWLGFCAASLYGNGFEKQNVDQLFDPVTSESIFTAFYETAVLGYVGQHVARTWPLPEIAKYCKWVAAALNNEAVGSLVEELPWTNYQLLALNFATSNHLQLFSVEIQEPTNSIQSSIQSIMSRSSRKSIGRGDLSLAKDGDVVAIVYGCKLPILLHKEGHGYRVLSGLYVHGFMHGEAI